MPVGFALPRPVRVSVPTRLSNPIPQVDIPEGRWLDLPLRGRTWLTDMPGPTPEAQTVILLHAVGCTGLLTWFPALTELNKQYRVVTFDQRWHGRGIVSDHFSLQECANDVAAVIVELGLDHPIVAGYSMGGVIAQRVWRQHPDKVGGLVLAATTDHFRTKGTERAFHQAMEWSMGALRALSRSKVVATAARRTAELLDVGPTDTGQWAINQWRSTSPWAVAEAVAALGRHHSTPWLSKIDVPTAVVATSKDKVFPLAKQRAMAARIPGATVHVSPTGHAGCVLEADKFVPVFVEAVGTVAAKARAAR